MNTEERRRERHSTKLVDYYWSFDRRLSLFLGFVVLLIFVIEPVRSRVEGSLIVVEIIFAFTLITGVLRVIKSKRAGRLAVVLVTATLAVRWLGPLWPGSVTEGVQSLLSGMTLGLLAVVILIDVFGPGSTGADQILGAVAAYLLIALVWADGYHLLEVLSPGALQMPASVHGPDPWSLTYFSLSTLSTVGYGNVTIAHPVAQSMAMMEAIFGQLYPAILIGRLVGTWTTSKA